MCNNSNSVGECDHSPLVVPCEYTEMHSTTRARFFEVTLHSLVLEDDENLTTYSFLHYSDYIFNAELLRECGYKVTLVINKVIVSERSFPWLYDKIIRYENVLDTIHGKERKRKYTFKKH